MASFAPYYYIMLLEQFVKLVVFNIVRDDPMSHIELLLSPVSDYEKLAVANIQIFP